MLNNKKIVVVLPAYNAALTLKKTYEEIPFSIVDEVILVDDHSHDDTLATGQLLGIRHIIKHEENKGYGANQKTCYDKALSLEADIVIMLHPDYQYTPKLITAMCSVIAFEVYPVVFGSRILGGRAVKAGMPLYKYICNRILTLFQNILMGQKLSEYHTGYRAYSAQVLKQINYKACSNDFVFDNEICAQIFYAGFEIGEISCPAKYFPEASSINFTKSMIYGLGVVKTSIIYCLQKWGLGRFLIFQKR